MSDWQTRLRNGSIDSLEALPEKFGLGEDDDSPVPNILHRYPDGVLFLVSPVHASSCRFCTRRRKVGDSMMLSARRLEHILQKLREIPHIEIIRIGSRITARLPERVTPEFCEMVQHYRPIFMNTHFNHASELTPAAVAALDRLSRAGISLGNHSVLLKGVPHFVIDAPGGGGKVPLQPEYVERITEDEVVFRNYEGKRFRYRQPRPPVTHEPGVVPINAAAGAPARRRSATGSSSGAPARRNWMIVNAMAPDSIRGVRRCSATPPRTSPPLGIPA